MRQERDVTPGEERAARGGFRGIVRLFAIAAATLAVATGVVCVWGSAVGLDVEYFAGRGATSPLIASSRGVNIQTSIIERDLRRRMPEVFSARWSGYLVVGSPGRYQFAVTSDDGAVLSIDARVVVDNGGQHDMEERTGVVALEAGPHLVVLDYTQDGGLYGVQWAWGREGAALAPVPLWRLSGRRRSFALALGAHVVDIVWWAAALITGVLGAMGLAWAAWVAISGTADVPVGRRVTAALVLVVAMGAAVRVYGLAFGLPHTQARPDETIIIETARVLLARRLPQFYDYPWLDMWMLSGVLSVYYLWGAAQGTFQSVADMIGSWPVHWEPFFLASRGLSAACGTATIVAVFAIGRRLRDDLTGLVAALFVALAFLHARDSHFGTTDIAMTFFAVTATGLVLAGHRANRQAYFVAGGLAAGLSAGTKYNGVLVFVAIGVSYLVHLVTAGASRRRAALRDPRLLAFGLAFAAAFAVGVPFVVLSRTEFIAAMRSLSGALQTGDPRLELANGWIHHLQFSLRYGLGIPLLLAGLGGALALLARAPAIGVVFLGFPVAYYVVAGSLHYVFFRYAIPVVPFLCLTAAWGVVAAADRIVAAIGGSRWPATRLRAAVAIGMAAVIVAPSAWSTWRFDRIASRTDTRVEVSRWFDAHVPPGSSVLQSGSPYGHAQLNARRGYRQWVWDRSVGRFRDNPPGEAPDWITVQDSPVPSATQGEVTALLSTGYVRAADFQAGTFGEGVVYDQLDMFFIPFAGFGAVDRPGPNITVYRRVAEDVRDPR